MVTEKVPIYSNKREQCQNGTIWLCPLMAPWLSLYCNVLQIALWKKKNSASSFLAYLYMDIYLLLHVYLFHSCVGLWALIHDNNTYLLWCLYVIVLLIYCVFRMKIIFGFYLAIYSTFVIQMSILFVLFSLLVSLWHHRFAIVASHVNALSLN